MKKEITKQRIQKVIMAVLESPNKSAQRSKLWYRLKIMLEKYSQNNFGN